MTHTDPQVRAPVTRRRALRDAAFLAGAAVVAGLTLTASPALAKVAQKGVSYQPTPKGSSRCDACTLWQAPAACKLVAGDISPSGWCSLYAQK
jgi:hypothetical protein